MSDDMWAQGVYTCAGVITIVGVAVALMQVILWIAGYDATNKDKPANKDKPTNKYDRYPGNMPLKDILILHEDRMEYLEKQLEVVQKQLTQTASLLVYTERLAKGIHKDCDSTRGCIHRMDTNKE
jgi:hypothetical protein